jgi:hypothetical protein
MRVIYKLGVDVSHSEATKRMRPVEGNQQVRGPALHEQPLTRGSAPRILSAAAATCMPLVDEQQRLRACQLRERSAPWQLQSSMLSSPAPPPRPSLTRAQQPKQP